MQPYTDKESYRYSNEELAKIRKCLAIEFCHAIVNNFNPSTELGTFIMMGGSYTLADVVVDILQPEPKKEKTK